MLQSAAATAAVLALAAWAPLGADARAAAWLGATLSGGAGALALLLKRRALDKPGLKPALRAVGVMLAVRTLLLGKGLWVVAAARTDAELYFVAAFFAVYAAQQALQWSWVIRPEGVVVR
jgi:hypothetical protein